MLFVGACLEILHFWIGMKVESCSTEVGITVPDACSRGGTDVESRSEVDGIASEGCCRSTFLHSVRKVGCFCRCLRYDPTYYSAHILYESTQIAPVAR